MSTTERQWHRDLSEDDPLSRSVAAGASFCYRYSLGPGSASASEANREVIWGGKGPFPCLFPPPGSLIPGYFRYQACRNHHSLFRYGFRVSAIFLNFRANRGPMGRKNFFCYRHQRLHVKTT